MTDIEWDEIVSIEYIDPDPNEMVYDFSVEDVETFTTKEGLIVVHNTLKTVRNSTGHIIQFVYGGDNMDGCFIEPNMNNIKAPFNLKRMLEEFPKSKTKLSQEIIQEELEKLFQKIENCSCLMDCVKEETLEPIKILVKSTFQETFLTEKNFKKVVKMIYERYERGMIQPSEMVGLIAGQSLGERNTQLTLNTFHSAGVNSKLNVNQGVPRLEE